MHQEVFLEVRRWGPSFDPARATLGTWILLIARSRAIDHLRKRVPEPRDPQAPGALAAREPEQDPETCRTPRERWGRPMRLGRLPERRGGPSCGCGSMRASARPDRRAHRACPWGR